MRTSTSWQPGKSGNPAGRLPAQREREYLTTLQRLCPQETWAKICERAIVDALAGDRFAREWLGNYLLGKPAPPAGADDARPEIIISEREAAELLGNDPSTMSLDELDAYIAERERRLAELPPGDAND